MNNEHFLGCKKMLIIHQTHLQKEVWSGHETRNNFHCYCSIFLVLIIAFHKHQTRIDGGLHMPD